MSHFNLPSRGRFVGRVWRPGIGPCVVVVQGGGIVDITSSEVATMRDLMEHNDPLAYIDANLQEPFTDVATLEKASFKASDDPDQLRVLAPCDLQAIKACGVTFANSMVERVIEERAGGDPSLAESIRTRLGSIIGDNLSGIVPGSERALEVKELLIKEGYWSQYLEVGIGTDAEVFTKSQPMSAVGWGAEIGIHPISTWNNPEPEVVLAVNSDGRILGVTLGNDVNLRDVEGRSALLLGKAKDNNASAAIGPFIRLFDDDFQIEQVREMNIQLTVQGPEGFTMEGSSAMSEISRDPVDLVEQTIGRHHQYPDGLMLYLGTLFAPVQDRNEVGEGFTHVIGDQVSIAEPSLGSLENIVNYSTDCPPWRFGITALIQNLANRSLI